MTRLLDKLKKAGLIESYPNGMMRIRTMGSSMTRRQFTGLMAAGAGLAATGFPSAGFAAGNVRYMGWQGYEEAFSAGDFAASQNITLSPTFQNDNGHAMTVIASGGKGNMDIVTPDTAYTALMAEVGMLAPIDLARIPNFSELDPFFQNNEGVRHNGEVYALPFVWTIIPLMYNPAHIPEAPESWFDILKPEYKGKVGMTNDMISMMVCFSLAVTGRKDATRISRAELKEVLDFLIKVKKNHARTVVSSYGELTDLLASGEIWISQGWVPVQLWAKGKGADIRWTVPKEGAHVPIDCMAIVKDNPNPDDTYALLNHAMSAEAQAHTANVNATGVTNAKAIGMLNQEILDIQPHDDITGFFEASTGGQPLPLWPTEADGDLATFDDVLDAWDKFLSA
ncbi:extracellular solute-binding protein [Rhizobiales bacterium]|uniref:ABC transporter substrate-binding protein n=1 Tax=Hongsoonwoonella zoysiae TaxID=2821844 RepID=UPI001561ACAD|nr:extracellular solute-binding protein [Hongsoonwoonella zoysiae]NRG17752.1 extracellular solute-binding protein [Hongsoonwoonella zoysiae]